VNPFLEGVGQDVTQTPPPKAAGRVRGDTEGLYGGTQRGTSCDAAKLVAFLQAHPEKGVAWAGVLKLTLQQIPSFVSQLTPVILRADTRVTNHGFEDGRVTPFPLSFRRVLPCSSTIREYLLSSASAATR
jgi:hypothetical protein